MRVPFARHATLLGERVSVLKPVHRSLVCEIQFCS